MIICSPRAVALLRTAEHAARRFDPAARIRLVPHAGGVRFELADRQEAGDTVIDHDAGFSLIVAAGLSGTVDVAEPHDRLVLIGDDGTSV